MNSTSLTISKANSFVQASYSMTLDEMRILSLTLGVLILKILLSVGLILLLRISVSISLMLMKNQLIPRLGMQYLKYPNVGLYW